MANIFRTYRDGQITTDRIRAEQAAADIRAMTVFNAVAVNTVVPNAALNASKYYTYKASALVVLTTAGGAVDVIAVVV
jgi:hypothetical protein